MTQVLSPEIVELVCTRISHDLVGSIGTVSNALEMWEDDPEDVVSIKPLLENSSQTLGARMKFFRIAFGLKNAAPKEISELNEIIDKYLLTIGNPKAPILMRSNIQNVSYYKILMLSVMALADVFVRGGEIKAFETEESLVFEATSDFELSASKLENMKNALKGKIPEENPALLAPIIYLNAFLSEAGVEIKLESSDKKAVLSVC